MIRLLKVKILRLRAWRCAAALAAVGVSGQTLPVNLPTAPALGTAALTPGPRVEWKMENGGNGHEYQAVEAPSGINWADAEAWAEKQGGYLATVATRRENEFVFNLVTSPRFWRNDTGRGGLSYSTGPWLGGWRTPEGSWRWLKTSAPFTYTNWGPGQPDNAGGNENRLHYSGPGYNSPNAMWNDYNEGNEVLGFVVEYDPDPATVFAQDPPKLQIPLLFAAGFSVVIFFLGLIAFLFPRKHHPASTKPQGDSGDQPTENEELEVKTVHDSPGPYFITGNPSSLAEFWRATKSKSWSLRPFALRPAISSRMASGWVGLPGWPMSDESKKCSAPIFRMTLA